MSGASTIDGYPIHPTDSDFAIQEAINRSLGNCHSMASLYPTMGELYRELFDTPDRSSWLGPALKRLDWNLRENPEGEHWGAHFGPMIELILTSVETAGEDELSLLCEWAGFLKSHNCHHIAEKIAAFAWRLRRGKFESALCFVLASGGRAGLVHRADWRAQCSDSPGVERWGAQACAANRGFRMCSGGLEPGRWRPAFA
jgi:hypothetical protein